MITKKQNIIKLLKKYSKERLILESPSYDNYGLLDEDEVLEDNLFKPRRVEDREQVLRDERINNIKKRREELKNKFKTEYETLNLKTPEHFYIAIANTIKKENWSSSTEYVFLVKTRQYKNIESLVNKILDNKYPSLQFEKVRIIKLADSEEELRHKGVIAGMLEKLRDNEKNIYSNTVKKLRKNLQNFFNNPKKEDILLLYLAGASNELELPTNEKFNVQPREDFD